MYNMDTRLQKVLREIKEINNIEENKKFQKWLKSDTDRNISNYSKIETMTYAIFNTLKHSNYKINNEKEFKDELATYIYRISQKECPREI